MSGTTAELQANLREDLLATGGGYLFTAQDEEGAARLSNSLQARIGIARSLFGILPATTTFEEAKEERMGEL